MAQDVLKAAVQYTAPQQRTSAEDQWMQKREMVRSLLSDGYSDIGSPGWREDVQADSEEELTEEDFNIFADEERSIYDQLAQEYYWKVTPLQDGTYSVDQPGWDLGRAAGTVWGGAVDALGNTANAAGAIFNNAGAGLQQATQDPGGVLGHLGGMLGQALPDSPEDAGRMLDAAIQKGQQVPEETLRALLNMGVDINNAGYGYPAVGHFDELQWINQLTGARGFDGQKTFNTLYGQDAETMYPGTTQAVELASQAIPGIGAAKKLQQASALAKVAGVGLTEAGVGAITAKTQKDTSPRKRFQERAGTAAIYGGVAAAGEGAAIGLGKLRKRAKITPNTALDVPQTPSQTGDTPRSTEPRAVPSALDLPYREVKSAEESARVLAKNVVNETKFNLDTDKLLEKMGYNPAKVLEARVYESGNSVRLRVKAQGKLTRTSLKVPKDVVEVSNRGIREPVPSKTPTTSTERALRQNQPGYEESAKQLKLPNVDTKRTVAKPKKGRARAAQAVRQNPDSLVEYRDAQGKTIVEKARKPQLSGIETDSGVIPYKRIDRITSPDGKVRYMDPDRVSELRAKREQARQAIRQEIKEAGDERIQTMKDAGVPEEEAAAIVAESRPKVEYPIGVTYRVMNQLGVLPKGRMIGENKILTDEGLQYLIGATSSTRNQTISATNNVAKKMAQDFKEALEVTGDQYKDYYGNFNLWREGLEPPGGFTTQEEEAFKVLKASIEQDNKLITHPLLMEAVDGDEKLAKYLEENLDYVTAAERGTHEYRLDMTDLAPADIKTLEAAVHTFEYDGRKQAILGYSDSQMDFIKRLKGKPGAVTDPASYYKTKFPFLYDKNGELKEGLIKKYRNYNQVMMDQAETGRLTYDNLKSIRSNLAERGYDPKEISQFMSDIAANNLTNESAYSRAYRMFVGSLQSKGNRKLMIATDPIQAKRLQNIQLAKKIAVDKQVAKLRDIRVKIDKEEEALFSKGEAVDTGTGLGARMRQVLGKYTKEEQIKVHTKLKNIQTTRAALKTLEDMARRKPTWFTKKLLDNDSVRDAGINVRQWADRLFAGNSVAKLSMSATAVGGNLVEAPMQVARLSGQYPKATANLVKEMANPINAKELTPFFSKVVKRMEADPYYGHLYKYVSADPNTSPLFMGIKEGANALDTSVKAVTDMALSGINWSMKRQEALSYRYGELIADELKLTGRAKHDKIYDIMVEMGTVTEMNEARLMDDIAGRAAMQFQNYMFNILYNATSDVEKVLQDALPFSQRPFRAKYAKMVMTYAAGATALASLKSHPLLSSLDSLYGWVNGGVSYSDSLKTDDSGNVLNALQAYGMIGVLTGIDPSFVRNEPGNLASGGPLVRTGQNLLESLSTLVNAYDQSTHSRDGNRIMLEGLRDATSDFISKEVVPISRWRKRQAILEKGVVETSAKNVVLNNISPELQEYLGRLAGVGLRTTMEENAQAATRKERAADKYYKESREGYRKQLERAILSNDQEARADIVDRMRERGVSVESLKRTILGIEKKKNKTQTQRLRDKRSAAQRRYDARDSGRVVVE